MENLDKKENLISLKPGILDRLNAGEVIICDGGCTHAFERRGYVNAGAYTPEIVLEYPSAGQRSE